MPHNMFSNQKSLALKQCPYTQEQFSKPISTRRDLIEGSCEYLRRDEENPTQYPCKLQPGETCHLLKDLPPAEDLGSLRIKQD